MIRVTIEVDGVKSMLENASSNLYTAHSAELLDMCLNVIAGLGVAIDDDFVEDFIQSRLPEVDEEGEPA